MAKTILTVTETHSDVNFLIIYGRSRYPSLDIWVRNTGHWHGVEIPLGNFFFVHTNTAATVPWNLVIDLDVFKHYWLGFAQLRGCNSSFIQEPKRCVFRCSSNIKQAFLGFGSFSLVFGHGTLVLHVATAPAYLRKTKPPFLINGRFGDLHKMGPITRFRP